MYRRRLAVGTAVPLGLRYDDEGRYRGGVFNEHTYIVSDDMKDEDMGR
jgi:hypothetical protein